MIFLIESNPWGHKPVFNQRFRAPNLNDLARNHIPDDPIFPVVNFNLIDFRNGFEKIRAGAKACNDRGAAEHLVLDQRVPINQALLPMPVKLRTVTIKVTEEATDCATIDKRSSITSERRSADQPHLNFFKLHYIHREHRMWWITRTLSPFATKNGNSLSPSSARSLANHASGSSGAVDPANSLTRKSSATCLIASSMSIPFLVSTALSLCSLHY